MQDTRIQDARDASNTSPDEGRFQGFAKFYHWAMYRDILRGRIPF